MPRVEGHVSGTHLEVEVVDRRERLVAVPGEVLAPDEAEFLEPLCGLADRLSINLHGGLHLGQR